MGKKLNINSKTANKQTLKTDPTQHKVQLLQMALAEAIDQNEILRQRVCELQAELVAMQLKYQELTQKQQRKQQTPQPQIKKTRMITRSTPMKQ